MFQKLFWGKLKTNFNLQSVWKETAKLQSYLFKYQWFYEYKRAKTDIKRTTLMQYIKSGQLLSHYSASGEAPQWTKTGWAMIFHKALLVMCFCLTYFILKEKQKIPEGHSNY